MAEINQAVEKPEFIEKIRDIAGLYMDSPLMAIVLCVALRSLVKL
jgi:hypothetical protein